MTGPLCNQRAWRPRAVAAHLICFYTRFYASRDTMGMIDSGIARQKDIIQYEVWDTQYWVNV